MSFTLTDAAKARLAEVLQADERLRISVSGGGCSGFQYHFAPEKSQNTDDKVFGPVIIDEVSLGLLTGSELHYSEDLMGAAFTIQNPNATSKCGCGNSFSA
jgi:iron-sulfur cluster insertion protein